MQNPVSREILWIHGEVKSPPMSKEARLEIGGLLRLVQDGVGLSMPDSRPMPDIGARCHELRVNDSDKNWRVIYRIDSTVIVVLEVFNKTTRATPVNVIRNCRQRLSRLDNG